MTRYNADMFKRVQQVESNRARAIELHDCVLQIREVPRNDVMRRVVWGMDPENYRNLPQKCIQLNPDITYYMVYDLIAEPTNGLPVLYDVGWVQYFTAEEAAEFVRKHHGPLMRLKGRRLVNYINRHKGYGGLRALMW